MQTHKRSFFGFLKKKLKLKLKMNVSDSESDVAKVYDELQKETEELILQVKASEVEHRLKQPQTTSPNHTNNDVSNQSTSNISEIELTLQMEHEKQELASTLRQLVEKMRRLEFENENLKQTLNDKNNNNHDDDDDDNDKNNFNFSISSSNQLNNNHLIEKTELNQKINELQNKLCKIMLIFIIIFCFKKYVCFVLFCFFMQIEVNKEN